MRKEEFLNSYKELSDIEVFDFAKIEGYIETDYDD